MADKGHNVFRFEGVDKLLLVLLTVGVIDLDGPEMLPESMFVCFAEVSVVYIFPELKTVEQKPFCVFRFLQQCCCLYVVHVIIFCVRRCVSGICYAFHEI